MIRGHKLYWHQVERKTEDISENDEKWLVNGRVKDDSTQHTQIKPVKPDTEIEFEFKVYFENLSNVELGALCWALHPLGDETKDYVHSLGMGKPFGMGAVRLEATLHLTERKPRYQSLFEGNQWATGITGDGEKLSARTELTSRQKVLP